MMMNGVSSSSSDDSEEENEGEETHEDAKPKSGPSLRSIFEDSVKTSGASNTFSFFYV